MMVNDYIYTLCGLLKDEPASIQSFSQQPGFEKITDFTLPWHTLKVATNGVKDITIVMLPSTNFISHVTININGNADLKVSDLIGQLGMYRVIPKSGWNRPVELVFEAKEEINGFKGKIILESNDYQDAEHQFAVQTVVLKPG